MIWFRSANSHTGPQLHRCTIRGRTDGSIRLRADLLQKIACISRASTDEYMPQSKLVGMALSVLSDQILERVPVMVRRLWLGISERKLGTGLTGVLTEKWDALGRPRTFAIQW
jgi:hypothetical protein